MSNNPFAPNSNQQWMNSQYPSVEQAAYQYPDISGGDYTQYQQQQPAQQPQQPIPTGMQAAYMPSGSGMWPTNSGSQVMGQQWSGMGMMQAGQQQPQQQPQMMTGMADPNQYQYSYVQPQQQQYSGVQNVSGMSYGQPQMGYSYAGVSQSNAGYDPNAGRFNPNNPAVATFDPLAPQSQQQQQPSQTAYQPQQQPYQQPPNRQQAQSQASSSAPKEEVKMQPGLTPTISNYGAPDSKFSEHPRQYVQRNKYGLEQWDETVWKGLFEHLIALRDAWDARRAYINQLPKQWPGLNVDVPKVVKECTENMDLCSSCRFQLVEAKEGYRHSHDAASRARVRDALNGGLSMLPEWPSREDELRNSLPGYLSRPRPTGPGMSVGERTPQAQQPSGPQMWTPQGQVYPGQSQMPPQLFTTLQPVQTGMVGMQGANMGTMGVPGMQTGMMGSGMGQYGSVMGMPQMGAQGWR